MNSYSIDEVNFLQRYHQGCRPSLCHEIVMYIIPKCLVKQVWYKVGVLIIRDITVRYIIHRLTGLHSDSRCRGVCAGFGIGAWGISQIQTSTDVFNVFPDRSPIVIIHHQRGVVFVDVLQEDCTRCTCFSLAANRTSMYLVASLVEVVSDVAGVVDCDATS